MAHPFSGRPHFEGVTDELFGFGTGAVLDSSVLDCLRDYARSIGSESSGDSSLWTGYASLYAGPMATLRQGSTEAVQDLASELYSSPLTHGFSQGAVVTADLRSRAEARAHVGAITLDRLYRLAEAVGVNHVKSAEHGQRTILVGDIDGLMSRIEDAVGVALPSTRQSGSLFGLRIRGSIYSERHFDGMYAAWRLRELVRKAEVKPPSLLEIGGGAGFLTFYALKFGFQKAAIIDLPHTAITQYIVLATELGAENVQFGNVPSHGVGLIGTDNPRSKDFTGWNAVANVDALPEMPPDVARDYLSRIKAGQIFLSINQESGIENGDHRQNIVADVAASVRLVRKQRNLSWLRTGYVEEVYEGT